MPRPLQVIAVSLQAGAGSAGRLLGEVDRLQARGGVRVLDVLLMSKQHDGSIVQASFGDDEDFGALVARLFPLDGGAVGGPDEPPAQLWAKAEASAGRCRDGGAARRAPVGLRASSISSTRSAARCSGRAS